MLKPWPYQVSALPAGTTDENLHDAHRVSALAAGRGDDAAALVFECIGFYRRLGYTETGAPPDHPKNHPLPSFT